MRSFPLARICSQPPPKLMFGGDFRPSWVHARSAGRAGHVVVPRGRGRTKNGPVLA